MSGHAEPGPRFVPRKYINPRFEDDLHVNLVSGPAEYAHETGLPVRYLAVADERGVVTTYVWANDEDGAAGWIVRRDAGTRARNKSTWLTLQREARARGVAPTTVLHDLVRDASAGGASYAVAGPVATAPHLDALYDLADLPTGRVRRSAHGALLGLATGDAMGRPLSALTMDRIGAVYGGWEQMELPLSADELVRVSDSTQLALTVAEALAEITVKAPLTEAEARHSLTVRGALPALPWVTPGAVSTALRTHLVRWLRSPGNDRSPGRTTLDACTALEGPVPWQAAPAPTSKGCAAVVRAVPVGLAPYLSGEQRSAIAQLQAALTHGHPTALAASDLVAHAVHLLAHRCRPADLLPRLRAHAAASRRTYRADWLGDLAARAGAEGPASFIATGWDECLTALDKVSDALEHKDPGREPGAAVGTAWTADEVLAAALYAYLVVDAHPRNAVRRAAHTSGASAATAALAGAFAGAAGGLWPPEWAQAMEYRERIDVLETAWDRN